MPFQSPGRAPQEDTTHRSEAVPPWDSRKCVLEQRRSSITSPIENDNTLSTRSAPPSTKIKKQSPEYVLKSGLAGGFAGCAVDNDSRFAPSEGYVIKLMNLMQG